MVVARRTWRKANTLPASGTAKSHNLLSLNNLSRTSFPHASHPDTVDGWQGQKEDVSYILQVSMSQFLSDLLIHHTEKEVKEHMGY